LAQFVLTYLGGDQPSSPEEGKKYFARYQEWLAELGDAAISPMNPLKGTQTVNADGSVSEGSSVSMSGYTIIEADSMDAAVDITKACPFLEMGGSMEVAEKIQMG
jgi:hypothetical protein